jgi:hypothetical protein
VRTAALLVLGVLLVAGCSGDPPAPLPSGTPGGGAVTRPGTTSTAPPTVATITLPPPVATDRDRFRALVGQWQGARSAFLGLVSSGRGLTLAGEKQAAATFLAAERSFAAALATPDWPAKARAALAQLRRQSVQMQSHLSAMAAADSRSTFTERLADYSVDVGRDDAAIRAVDRALA